jgi:hypothetical protein
MSALVWSVESVFLALWALALASVNPNPLHTFLARSHALLAGFTLMVQLFISARLLAMGHAVSEAFVCAVSALFVVYLVVLFDSRNYADPLLFSYFVHSDFLPLDACVGIGWFAAALISALGMALSDRERPSRLMFHQFGFHMLIVPPSFLVFWLYSATDSTILFGARVTYAIYCVVLLAIWVVFIVLQAVGESLLTYANWPDGDPRRIVMWVLRLVGQWACVLIAVSALFIVRTGTQTALVWTLIGIGIVNAVDWIWMLDWILTGGGDAGEQQDGSPSNTFGARLDPAALALHIKEF